jgi:hypothetical protein
MNGRSIHYVTQCGQLIDGLSRKSVAPINRQVGTCVITPRASGVEPIVWPPRSPNLNAHGERFVRSITAEALDQVIVIGEAALRSVLQSYLTQDHHERNHQGLGNQLMVPEPGMGSQRGSVMRREMK